MTPFNLRSFDRRLSVRYEPVGEGVQIQGLHWHSQWYGTTPVLWVGFEAVNSSDQDLEIVSIGITLRDASGQELAHEPSSLEGHYWGDVPQGHVLLSGDTRPETARVSLSASQAPQPLSWTEAVIELEVRPANPDGLALYWRSYNVEVLSAGYTSDQSYVLQGHVADFDEIAQQFHTGRKGRVNVQAVVSLYNANGEVVGGFGVPVVDGNLGNFELNLDWPADDKENRITDYTVWFAELYP